ncbi:hypothetical protein HCN44_003164 [Aphidius gifuensis]|uniref:Nuclear respiratory factor 1 NLS/DNA-binding dimerisation domain-containing protein n=1 Tax=Aphidius gifuensis TaxID=684658 RepID=A0A834XIF4_APHGI|nr:BEACH domain-containing protein lvsE isoform X2 [Aphidius gifuensis]XP_044018495.1 BEACH domain-containing protein lvsE isoform X2 [Aphidius gifuensis]KAF7987402.1 hypothetical protein HCN44_003164 [Aphidius gifuensis]
MRFSAVQEDGYGVGLGQEHVPNNNVDDIMMAATGGIVSDSENIVDECSMTYNLPLLFASGYPSSLDKISVPELEKFITFMVQCSYGGPNAPTLSRVPPWWPEEIQYSIPFIRPSKVSNEWLINLKKLVSRCYTYHSSEYLLRFCKYLAQYPREKLRYVNNWDSTTSLYHKSTGKLLATFRNENMDYDKVVESPRRSLLPPNGATSNLQNKKSKTKERRQVDGPSLVVIQPEPSQHEIYLCDNCDAEFEELDQMKDHEKICSVPVQNDVNSRPVTPCDIVTELSQNKFLDYFKLFGGNEVLNVASSSSSSSSLSLPPSLVSTTTNSTTTTINTNSNSISHVSKCIAGSTRSSRRTRTTVNLARCPAIPFSSPAGLAMLKKSRVLTDDIKLEKLERIEKHTIAPALNNVCRPKWLNRPKVYSRWSVTYKPNREKPQRNYTHKYTFGAFKRKKFELNIRSQILYVSCQNLYIHLDILTTDELEDLKQNPWKYRSPVPKYIPNYRRENLIKNIIQPSTITGIKRKNLLHPPAPSSIQKKRMKLKNNNNNNDNNYNKNLIKNINEKDKSCQRNSEPSTIVLVDLCSSDDDDNTPIIVLSDENRDPAVNNSSKLNFFRNVTSQTNNNSNNNNNNNSNKFRQKSLGNFTSGPDWLCDNLLNDDNDKCTTNVKCLGNSIDSSNTFSSVLKQTP